MENRDNIIISIHPKYAKKIDAGEKKYEIRTRKMNIKSGTRAWIYRTYPDACISSVVTIETILCITPLEAWEQYSKQLCISKANFNKYTKGRKEIYLLKIVDPIKFKQKYSLKELRVKIPSFYPPQFFKKLTSTGIIMKHLQKYFHI